jgi:hypothetical protein
MATYIKGVTDVIPDQQGAKVDWKVISSGLTALQGRYNKGFDQVKGMYNSLINSALSSSDNEQFRQEYLKKADQYLTQMAGVDLANPNNVMQATQVFDPLVNDPEYVMDIAKTKQQQNEYQKVQSVKVSTDEKIRGQYSSIMESAIGYGMQDLSKTKRGDGSIAKARVQKYIPFANIEQELGDLAHKQGLVTKTDEFSGSYIITRTNGEIAIPNFTQWARINMGNKYDEQLMITANVGIRNQVESLMNSNPNLTSDQAYGEVAKTNSYNIYSNTEDYTKSLSGSVAAVDKQIAQYRSKYGNKIPAQYKETIQQLQELKSAYNKELGEITQNKQSTDEKIKIAFDQFMSNPGSSLLNYTKDNTAKGWADSYARSKSEVSVKVNDVVENEKQRDFEEMMNARKYNQDIQKTLFEKQLDFDLDVERERLGIGSKKDGKSTSSRGYLTTSTDESKGEYGAYTMFQQEKMDALNKVEQSYFDRDVLSIATSSDNFQRDFGHSHVEFNTAVQNVMDNWSKYRDDISKDPTYAASYKKVFRLINWINPDLKKIGNIATIFNTIGEGVSSYQGTDATKLKKAQMALSVGDENFEIWRDLTNGENANLERLKTTDFYSFEYFDKGTYDRTGKLVLRPDLKPEDRNMMIKLITPNWETKYKNMTASNVTGFTLSGVDDANWDYSVLDEIIKNATDVNDSNKPELGKNSKDRASSLKKTYAGLGDNLKDVFTPNGMKFSEFYIGSDAFYKIDVPVKRDKDQSPLVAGLTGGSISLYLPKKDGDKIFTSMRETNVLGKTYQMPNFGQLSELPSRIFHKQKPVSWIDVPISKGQSIIPFPSIIKNKYGIKGGGIEIDPISGSMNVRFKTPDNKDVDYPLGGTLNDYLADPVRFGNMLNQSIITELEKYNNARLTSMESQRSNHQIAVNQDPGAYVNLDELLG